MLELFHGHVDAKNQRRAVRAEPRPFACLATSTLHNPTSQRHDQVRLLGEWYELFRIGQAAFGMLPAHQGFHERYLARAQAHYGLVVETERFLFYGQSKLALQVQPLPRSGI